MMRNSNVQSDGTVGRPRTPIEHGILAGYRKHLRRGERPCSECKAAWRRYIAERRAKGKK